MANTQHLEFIHNTINRMSSLTQNTKNWSVTAMLGFIAVAFTIDGWEVKLLGAIPILFFWFLAAHYLAFERRYRELYKDVINTDKDIPSYDMNIAPYKDDKPYWEAFFRPTNSLFFLPQIIFVCLVAILSTKQNEPKHPDAFIVRDTIERVIFDTTSPSPSSPVAP